MTLSPLIPGSFQPEVHGGHKTNNQMSKFLPFPGVMNRGLSTSLGAFKYIKIFCVLFCFSPSPSHSVTSSDGLWRMRELFLETSLILEIINLAATLALSSWTQPYLKCSWHIKGANTCSQRVCSLLRTQVSCPHASSYSQLLLSLLCCFLLHLCNLGAAESLLSLKGNI